MTDGGEQTTAPAGGAAVPASPAPHIVHIAERCPGSPHPYDVVTLREEPTLPMGVAVATILNTAMGDAPLVEAGLALEFTRWGIASWTFVDDGPVRVSEPLARETLERWLPFSNGGLEVMEAASTLYRSLLDPFVARMSKRLPHGPADHLTSQKNGSGATPRKRSKRSSPASSAGKRSGVPAR